jgi:crossover junction endodeoxyribonuclease RusA
VIVLTLPFPPSTNNLFRNAGKRRIKTDRYTRWITEAGWWLSFHNVPRLSGPYALALTLHPPTRAARDLDNFVKAVSDLLVAHEVIDGDHLARRIVLEWSDIPPAKPGSVTITLEAAQ